MTSQERQDFLIAYNMHKNLNSLGVTENAVFSEKENYKPRTLIDETLELIDPTPNIYTLFVQFNTRYFWNVLLPVEVKWSNKMTSCAGNCTFHRRNKQCVISLSAPLLKLRPRKDLVETLLHEMIHAYLFLTTNDLDREGHGPNFCKHMDRINKEAGTNITIYHNFHNEVRLYQQHWWKCNGPCQYKPPFFGMIRRAINRAPGPSDNWWYNHKQNCNGQFIKVKEPENVKTRSKKNDISKLISTEKKSDKNISDPKKNSNGKTVKDNIKDFILKCPKCSCSGTLGGSNSGQSNLLNKLFGNQFSKLTKKNISSVTNNKPVNKPLLNLNQSKSDSVSCPICNISISLEEINRHIDLCLISDNKSKQKTEIDVKTKRKIDKLFSSNQTFFTSTPKKTIHTDIIPNKRLKLDDLNESKYVNCPVCNKMLPSTDINQHLDKCLLETDTAHKNSTSSIDRHISNDSIVTINISSSSDSNSVFIVESPKKSEQSCANVNINTNDSMNLKQKCLVCDAEIVPGISLAEHLEECIGINFNNSTNDNDDNDNDQGTSIIKDNSIENKDNKYPCPVCMSIVPENLMNQHLDRCLKEE